MRWRQSTESPRTCEPVTALIAVRDRDDGEIYLAGIYMWKDGRWLAEDTGEPFEGEFWWVYENELLQNLQAAMAGL